MLSKVQITASQLARISICPASAVLPSVLNNESSTAAYRGNVIHKFLEDYIHIGKQKALENINEPEYKLTCEFIDLEPVLNGNKIIQTEIGFKYNIETQTVVRINNYRDKGNKDNSVELKFNKNDVCQEITGICDIITISDNGEYTILDYKSGFERVSANNNYQLMFFAMCCYLLNTPTKITAGIVTILENGETRIEKQEISEESIKNFITIIDKTYKKVIETKTIVENNRNPDVITSDYCKYCPAINSCPAYNNLALSISDSNNLEKLLNINSLSNEEIGVVWTKLKQAQKIIEIVEENIKKIVKKEPIKLPNGKLLAQHQQSNEYIDVKKAEKILIEELGEEVTDQLIEKKVTKVKLRAIIQDKDRFDQIIERLSKEKALKYAEYTSIKEKAIPKKK